MKRLLFALALALAALAAAPAHAQHDHSGHDAPAADASAGMLVSSTPADGAVLERAPRTLTLAFAHPVILQTAAITGPNDAPVSATFRRAVTPTAVYVVALPPLASGAYHVVWAASGGGHSMHGALSFSVQ